MFRVILIFIFYNLCFSAFAQIPKKALKAYNKGKEDLLKNDLDKAILNFTKAYVQYPPYKDSYLELYRIYVDKNDGTKALSNLETALKYADKDKPNLSYQSAKLSLEIGAYDKTVQYVNQYLALNTKDGSTRELATLYKAKAEYAIINKLSNSNFNTTALSANINTTSPEYLPSIDALQENLVFTRRIRGNEDLYIAHKKYGDSSWRSVISWPLNTPQNEGAHTISADGKTIVFTRCNMPDGIGNCDLYISEFKSNVWTKPQNLGNAINSTSWESQPSLSANGRTLYFTSNRPGGKGGSDIWRSQKIKNVWKAPINLGDSINTKWDEASPFVHADGVHLYFRSNGWPGFGLNDLYRSELENSLFKSPANLGYPINDHTDQGSMVIALDGTTVYYTQQTINLKNELIESNIINFKLENKYAALPCIFLKGKIRDAHTNLLIPNASVMFASGEHNERKDSIASDENGEFLLIMPANTAYQVYASAIDYDFYTDRINTIGGAGSNLNYDILLHKIEIGDSITSEKPIVLKNVLFQTGSSILERESFIELDRVTQYLQDHANISVEIRGHTDAIGSAVENKTLSGSRAKAVYDYIVSRGIDKNRLTYSGFGDTLPISDNVTEGGRLLNRRVEIKLIKK